MNMESLERLKANVVRGRDALGLKNAELERKAKLKSGYIRDLLDAKTANQNRAMMDRLAVALGCTYSDLIAEWDEAPPEAPFEPDAPPDAIARSTMIPELAVRPQGGHGAADTDPLNGHKVVSLWSVPTDFLIANTQSSEAIRIVRVAGESMEPDYPANDRLMVDTSHQYPSPDGIYVLWDGFGLIVKRLELIPGTAPQRVRISSSHPAYKTYELLVSELHINGRVVGKWTWK